MVGDVAYQRRAEARAMWKIEPGRWGQGVSERRMEEQGGLAGVRADGLRQVFSPIDEWEKKMTLNIFEQANGRQIFKYSA